MGRRSAAPSGFVELVDGFVIGIHNAVIAGLCAGLALGICLLVQLLADLVESLLDFLGSGLDGRK